MTTPPRGLAARIPRARWTDARLWLGVGLLATSIALGVWILATPADTVGVWRAVRDVSVGAAPEVERVDIPRDVAEGIYLSSAQAPAGVLAVPLHAGELVPRSALVAGERASTRQVALAVDPARLPVGLQAGDLVDVWSAADDEPARLVLPGARVAAEPIDGGFGGELAVELEVPESGVAAIVDAVTRGPVSLAGVPVDSQAASS